MLLETLIVALVAESKGFSDGLKDADKEAEGWSKGMAGKVAKFAGGAALAGVTALAGAVTAVGAAAMSAWGEFDEASDALIHATGASGDALAEMEQSVKDLYGSTAGLGVTMGDIGAVMGEVQTRTGLTGDGLESLTSSIMNFSRMTGVDGVNATASLTRTMGDWGVSTENATSLLNQMYGAGQKFGITFDSLSGKLVQFGAPLRQMGFSLEESMAMLGKWEQEGVNTELVIGSLRIAAGKFADANVPLRDGLNQTMEAIKAAGSESEALSIAMDTFGARAGPDMAAAIREGRFEIEAAVEALQGTETALDDASERVLDFPDAWEMATKQVTTALVPLGTSLAELISAVLPALTGAIGWVVDALGPWIDRLSDLIGMLTRTVDEGKGFSGWLDRLPEPLRRVSDAIGGIIDWFRNLGGTISEQGTGKLSFLKDWVDQNLPRLQQIFEAVLGAIQGFWDTFGGSIMTVVDFVFGTIWTVIDTALKNVMDLVSAVLQILTGDFEGGFNTLIGIAERTVQTLRGIMQGLVGAIVDAVTQIDWLALGENIIMGMINGITNMSQRLWDAARSVSQNMWDRMTGWWQTGSPSRKAEDELGVPIAEGLMIGIGDGIDLSAIDASMGSVFEGMSLAQPVAAGATNNYITINVSGADREESRLGVLDGLRQAGMMA